MVKPIGYYGASYDNALIKDIAEHFNELQDINETDQYWVLARLGSHHWMKWNFETPSEAIEEVRDRLEELDKYQLACLIHAVGDKTLTKPLGYYSLKYELPLIKDIHDHFGDYLENMSEVEQMWIIGMMCDHYFMQYCPEDIEVSDAAEEIYARRNELNQTNCGALIQALANK